MANTEPTGTTRASRKALRDALIDAGLYNDSSAFVPVVCVETTEPPQVGTKVTEIPCSESKFQIAEIVFEQVAEVIPADTLVLIVGKQRL